ncbi:MAG: hypothetical protein JOY63_05485, partial [Acetobacteraceae bacterium]|nr:hypothetical protein [Acetobacteraceae bacterium]
MAHNAVFDAAFLWRAGIEMVPDCTMLAAHALTGRRESLAALAAEHLGRPLDKGL